MAEATADDLASAPVPYDPELAAALALLAPTIVSFDTVESIPERRAAVMREMDLGGISRRVDAGTLVLSEFKVPGPAGAPDLTLLVLRPTAASGPTPCFYYMHGGGMILGSARSIPEETLGWAEQFGVTIVSVDYRLAPETPHPGPVDDCYAGLLWTEAHADELGIDPTKIVAVGTSAGGGLAAAIVLMARDRRGPVIAGQILMSPMLDDRNDSASAIQNQHRGIWTRRDNQTGWTALLGDAAGGADTSPYAAPAREVNFHDLPRTLIDVGSAETFRDESVAYASALWSAGVDVELHVFSGGFHGYEGLAPHAAVSRNTYEARLGWLARFFDQLSATGARRRASTNEHTIP